MGLSDLAAGLEVTAEQRDRGVATVDDTEADLADRLAAHGDELPCTPEAAETVVETHRTGTSVGESARAAAVAPVTAAKVLHRCGVDGVSPLAPEARRIVRDWLDGRLSRADALELTGASESEFSLVAYLETHDPVPELVDAVSGARTGTGASATVEKREALAETMSSVSDLR